MITWIPGYVVTAATFPGFVMTTVARRFWCDVLGIPVYEAQYFKGTLVHGKIESPLQAALVTFAPLTVNTLLCAILLFPVGFSVMLGGDAPDINPLLMLILMWAGVSIGMHALPSRSTVRGYLDNLPAENRLGWTFGLLRVLGAVFVLVDLLKRVWFDAVYAVIVGLTAPWVVTKASMIW